MAEDCVTPTPPPARTAELTTEPISDATDALCSRLNRAAEALAFKRDQPESLYLILCDAVAYLIGQDERLAALTLRLGPGKTPARFEWFLAEIDKRLPDPNGISAEPPELRYLAMLDERLATLAALRAEAEDLDLVLSLTAEGCRMAVGAFERNDAINWDALVDAAARADVVRARRRLAGEAV